MSRYYSVAGSMKKICLTASGKYKPNFPLEGSRPDPKLVENSPSPLTLPKDALNNLEKEIYDAAQQHKSHGSIPIIISIIPIPPFQGIICRSYFNHVNFLFSQWFR